MEVQNYGENEEKTVPKKILYNLSSYTSQDIKWHLARRLDDEKIKAAKKNKATTSQ